MPDKREKWLIAGGAALFVAAVMAISVGKWLHLGFNGFDLAIYNQTFWNTVHGRLFADSINPPIYLGDHAEWLLILLAPFYALAPHPLTLVLLQAAALAAGVIPVWLIARRLNPRQGFRLLWAALYLANPFLWNLALSEFHFIAFAVPLILFAAWFYIKRDYPLFIAAASACLLVREDMAFAVVGFALLAIYDLIRHREESRRQRDDAAISKGLLRCARNDAVKWAVIPALIAIAVFIFDQKAIAHFNPDGAYKFLTYYSWLGGSPLQVMAGALAHPLRVVAHVATAKTLEVAVVCLLPFLFLPLIRPRWLIIAILPAAEYGLVGFGIDMIMVKMQYIAPFLPVLLLSAMEAHAALLAKGNRVWKIVPRPLFPLLLIIATVTVWLFYGPGLDAARAFAAPDARTRALRQAIDLIPPGATAISSLDALAPLSSREYVWPTSYVWSGKKQFGASDYVLPVLPDYLILDQEDLLYFISVYPYVDWAKPYYSGFDANLRKIISGGNFGIVFERDGVALLKRGSAGPMPFVSASTDRPVIAHPADQAFGAIRYLGWNGPAAPEGPYRLYFAATGKIDGQPGAMVNGKIDILGNGLYGPAEWKPGEIVEIEDFGGEAPYDLKIVKIQGGLYANGDGSLTLKVKTDPWH